MKNSNKLLLKRIATHLAALGILLCVSTPIFAQAEKQNALLSRELEWTFGKKPQKGWYLYESLIADTLKITARADSKAFSESVARWQLSHGIPADGVVNETTLLSFIEYWQSRRIRPVYEATTDQLVSAPITDFWDMERPANMLQLDREAYASYLKMVAAARKDGAKTKEVFGNPAKDRNFLRIISAYRSPQYQAELRAKQPDAGRGQLASRSPHFTGRALDIFVGGEPVTTRDDNRAIQVKTWSYKWLVKNAEKFGFTPYFFEPWHWEYVGVKELDKIK